MVEKKEIDELCEVYREMNQEGKKTMVRMAGRLLLGQRAAGEKNTPSSTPLSAKGVWETGKTRALRG